MTKGSHRRRSHNAPGQYSETKRSSSGISEEFIELLRTRTPDERGALLRESLTLEELEPIRTLAEIEGKTVDEVLVRYMNSVMRCLELNPNAPPEMFAEQGLKDLLHQKIQ